MGLIEELKGEKETKKRYTFFISEKVKKQFRKIADKAGVSESAILQKLMENTIKEWGKK